MSRPVTVGVDGGDAVLRTSIAGALAPASDLALAPAGDLDLVDVVVACDDHGSSALDRCRASRRPCVVLLDEPSLASVSDAMRAGARGAVARDPLDAFGLVGAVRDAAAFRIAAPETTTPGDLVVVTGATGGAGATTVALALARYAAAPVALLDLDLGGGDLARRAGVGDDRGEPGLAGQANGRRAWERLARNAGFAHVVPAPRRPDLAWLVREGVCTELARTARGACATVIADIGRGAGPPLELVGEATLVVVVARPTAPQLLAAAEHAEFMDGLVAGRCPVRVCLTGTRLRDEVAIRLASAAHGFKVAARLPLRGAGEDFGARSDGALDALLGGSS